MKREAVGASPGIPRMGTLISVKVLYFMIIIILLSTNENSVSGKASEPAFVGAIGRTDEGETVIESVLIPVNFFPPSFRIMFKWIIDSHRRPKIEQGEGGRTK
jgi:hypothetical protein